MDDINSQLDQLMNMSFLDMVLPYTPDAAGFGNFITSPRPLSTVSASLNASEVPFDGSRWGPPPLKTHWIKLDQEAWNAKIGSLQYEQVGLWNLSLT